MVTGEPYGERRLVSARRSSCEKAIDALGASVCAENRRRKPFG